ncbi:MAG TPA: hypothetical protein VKH64_08690 [Candidatus Binatia bacterium]|nr:hypothetical protein [Candidatus Binatia bacterium]
MAQVRKKITAIAAVWLCLVGAAACSTTTGRKGLGPRPGTPEYYAELNSGEPKKPPPCSTWLNRGRAGGTVGSVVGFIVASAIGSPVLGILFQVAGYGAGFAAADPCKKNGAATQTAKSADANLHASAASAKITEEELQ